MKLTTDSIDHVEPGWEMLKIQGERGGGGGGGRKGNKSHFI